MDRLQADCHEQSIGEPAFRVRNLRRQLSAHQSLTLVSPTEVSPANPT